MHYLRSEFPYFHEESHASVHDPALMFFIKRSKLNNFEA